MNLDDIRERAKRFGFEDVGYWSCEELEVEWRLLDRWLTEGLHASMSYMERNRDLALDPRRAYPWAKGILVFLWRWESLHAEADPPWSPWTAAYARGWDYHDLFLRRIEGFINSLPSLRSRPIVDATPLQERAIARRAGLGWIGKNRYLFSKRYGGNVGLGEVLVDHEFEAATATVSDSPCHDCTLCLESCPTGALRSDGLDARLCLAYLTAEFRGSIPREMREAVGTRLLGCDTCLSACPYGMVTPPPPEHDESISFLKETLTKRTNREFARLFAGSSFMRLGRKATLRNAAVVSGNLGREDFIPSLEHVLTNDPAPRVREHAAWAIGKIGGKQARRVMECHIRREKDRLTKETIEIALTSS